jgi:hypothetical protein
MVHNSQIQILCPPIEISLGQCSAWTLPYILVPFPSHAHKLFSDPGKNEVWKEIIIYDGGDGDNTTLSSIMEVHIYDYRCGQYILVDTHLGIKRMIS